MSSGPSAGMRQPLAALGHVRGKENSEPNEHFFLAVKSPQNFRKLTKGLGQAALARKPKHTGVSFIPELQF